MPARVRRYMTWASAAVVIAAAVLVSLWHPAPGAAGAGSGPSAATGGPTPARAATPATIELSATQLGALRIQVAELRSFPVEKTAVGSISFDKDPAIVQAESTLIAAASQLGLTARELARVRSLGAGNGIPQKEL